MGSFDRVALVTSANIYSALCGALALLVAAWVLTAALSRLRRCRTDLDVALPVAAGFAIRVALMALLSASPSLSELRGPDDAGFLGQAMKLSERLPWSDPFADNPAGRLHVIVLAWEAAALGPTTGFALRTLQIVLAVLGTCLLAAAAYDLAGARAAKVVAWALAIEPSNVFFSGLVIKEPLMMVAEGTVALGAVRVWQRRDLKAASLLVVGCAVAAGMRPYIGVALAAAAFAITLHAAVRPLGPRSQRAVPIAAGIAILGVAGLAFVAASSDELLGRLQAYQTRNASDRSNLRLEPVNFSTPKDLVVNLPRRIRDLLFRPYPWQGANLSQQSGAAGTVAAWLAGLGLIAAVLAGRRPGLRRTPPGAYLLASLVLAYAVATGNSGTGFRYRTHVIALTILLAASVAPIGRPANVPLPQSPRPEPPRHA